MNVKKVNARRLLSFLAWDFHHTVRITVQHLFATVLSCTQDQVRFFHSLELKFLMQF
ncbi:unnamed protein product [Enterobius vermicularis]|uniref:Uncharacterized protein n=1 Tax=Enterobius vermicularis TaxID=51028 RepID=A0A0N4UXE4_ENTVE|nr:unnamed protein product [Enterobius vermicularis]